MSHGGDDDFPEEHEEHVNHEAWVIPYADLLTLLMAMFIALFAISTVDTNKFQALARGFSSALGGGKLDAGIGGSGRATSPVVGGGNGTGPFQGGTLMPSDTNVSTAALAKALLSMASNSAAAKAEHQSLADVQKAIEKAANDLHLGGKVRTKQLDNGLEVTLLTDRVLFDTGKANIRPAGVPILTGIGLILTKIDNPIEIDGYTDSVPLLPGGKYDSNDDLSSGRAVAVMHFFESIGLDASRLRPVGLGERNPIGDNGTDVGRALNRRVEIFVQSKVVHQILKQANADGGPLSTTPTTQPIVPPVNPGLGGPKPVINPGLGAG